MFKKGWWCVCRCPFFRLTKNLISMSEKVTPASEEQQRELDNILEDSPEYVTIPRTDRKYGIRWMKRGTIRKISHITHLDSSIVNDDRMSCKIAAAIILNGKWKITFFHWFLWRWFYYVKQYGDEQLEPIINMGKKKIPQVQYYRVTISAIEMRDTIKTMTKKEVEQFRQELSSAQATR